MFSCRILENYLESSFLFILSLSKLSFPELLEPSDFPSIDQNCRVMNIYEGGLGFFQG